MLNDLSRYRHGDDSADDEADQYEGKRAILKMKELLEYRHMARPGSETNSIHQKEHGERPLRPFYRGAIGYCPWMLHADCSYD